MSAFEDRFVSTFCKSHVIVQSLLNRANFLSKYARKGKPKYVQLIVVVAVVATIVVVVAAAAEVVVVVILNVDQN